MTGARPLLALLCVVLAVLGWPTGAWTQTFPSDDAGRPAPWCSYLDTSVTPNVSVVCSTQNPLPTGAGAASIATDTLGYGRAFFLSASGSPDTLSSRITTMLFVDEVTVMGWGVTGAGTTLASAQSRDGGRTWSSPASVGFGSLINPPFSSGVTVGTTPRYVIAVNGLASNILTSSSPSGGFVASTFGTGLNANPLITFAIQGATVMVWGQGGGGNNTAMACRSQDNGQTFSNCVVADATVNSAYTGNGARQVITSPSTGIWLAVGNTGRVQRSADNGATWTNVLSLSFGGVAAIKCVSATVCLVVDGGVNVMTPYRSTDAGATWTAQAAIATSSSGTGRAICLYGNNVLDVIQSDNFPSTSTGTTVAAQRSTDGGRSWVGVTFTGGKAAFSGANLDFISDCTSTATGRSAFLGLRTASTGLYFGPTTSNTVQVVGANGIPLNVDGNGNFTANQGLPQATSPNAWGVVPVQGPALFNSDTTGAANTAVTVTIAAVASQRVHLRRVEAVCSAGTSTLTVTDGATQRWGSLAGEVGAVFFRPPPWVPSLDSTTSQAMTITLATCGVGNAGRLIVSADQF